MFFFVRDNTLILIQSFNKIYMRLAIFKTPYVLSILYLALINNNLKSQTIFINSNEYYKEASNSDFYYFLFQVKKNKESVKLTNIQEKIQKFKFVEVISTEDDGDVTFVKVTINKLAEKTSGYYSDFFQNLSIDKIIVDGIEINSKDFYQYLKNKYTKKEVTNN